MNPVKLQKPAAVLKRQALIGAIDREVPGGNALYGVIDRSGPKSAGDKNAIDEWDDWSDADEHSDSDADPDDGSQA